MKKGCIFTAMSLLAASPVSANSSNIQFRLVVDCKPGFAEYLAPEGKQVCVSEDVIIDGTGIILAKPAHNEFSEIVSFTFDKAAQVRLSDVTSKHVGERMAIINGKTLVAAPFILGKISGPVMEVHTPDKKSADDILEQFQDRALVK